MNYTDLRIIFMGTPAFAVASLSALVQAGCNVVAVVTAADKPAGRGMELQQSDVKKYAVAQQIPVLQPDKLKSPEFIAELKQLKADIQVVVAFRMLPEIVWNMPPMGTINLHGSLLPQYRGAAPINRAIMNGETITGVTSFKLKHAIDTGSIILQEELPITAEDDAGTLHDKMKELGAKVVVKTIKLIAEGKANYIDQESIITDIETIQHAPKIFTADCEINWHKPATKILNMIRGLSPHPAAFTQLQGKKLKIFKAHIVATNNLYSPGEYYVTPDKKLAFAAVDGSLIIDELQLEGKKRMQAADFLRGYQGAISNNH